MVKYKLTSPSEEAKNIIFQSLSDPTRRKILERLLSSDLTVSQIAEPYHISLPAVSKHLKVLERAKLIKRLKHGREHTIQINPNTFATVTEYISFYTQFWNTQFEQLEKFLKGGESKRGK